MSKAKPRKRQRGNFKLEHNAAYRLWEARMDYSQARCWEDPDWRYIRDVQRGVWPTDPWRDPVHWVTSGRNTIEGAAERLEGQCGLEEGEGAGLIAARMIWEVDRFEAVWRCDYHDPSEAWAEATGRRWRKTQAVMLAITTPPPGRNRFPALDLALDMVSIDGDPEFAACLVDWVRALFPDYLEHCLTKRRNLSRRGRKQKGTRRCKRAG